MSEKTLEAPTLKPADLLVRLKAAAMNPVDVKVREGMAGTHERVVGYDGAGVVEALGAEADGRFKVGDEIMFSGDVTRNGTNAELCAVDSRICAKKPKTLTFAQAASFPLVTITAWELMFENLSIPTTAPAKPFNLLVINGAGGVGCITIQLAKKLLGDKCNVIATASRDETVAMCKSMGADHVISHRNLAEEVEKLGVKGQIHYTLCYVDLELHYDTIVDISRPGAKIGSITFGDPSKIDVSKLFFPKRLTLSFEMMFARPMLNVDPEMQGALLDRVSEMIDAGDVKHFVTKEFSGLSVATINEAQALQASGKAIGKIAIAF